MTSLAGKTVVLTDAAGGIGVQVAGRLQREGARLIGVDRLPSGKCDEMILGDLTREDGVASVCTRLAAFECDILINLPGPQYFGPFAGQSPQSLWQDYVANLLAPAALARAVLPSMMARRTGRIVNVGSTLGSVPLGHFATCASGKAGLKGLSDALRRELAGTGVGITHIAPRPVMTMLCPRKAIEFATATNMPMDHPSEVAARICEAIMRSEQEVTMGLAERLTACLHVLMPRLLDRLLAGRNRTAAGLFRPER